VSPHSLLLVAAATVAGIVVGCVGLIVGIGSDIESGVGPEPTLITGPSAANARPDLSD
jgi:hypothetical protein